MMMKRVMAIGILGILVCSVGIGMVIANTKDVNTEADGIEFTADELQDLYHKYNITENDIKFAEGRLPHFLEGTILDGKVVTMGMITLEENEVVVSEWIDPLFRDYCLKEGYKVISPEEWFTIEEKARSDYIMKYGVDPANPKIDIVDGVPLPAEYVRELVKSGKMSPGSDAEPVRVESIANSPVGPYAKYGKLYLWIVPAADTQQKPIQAYLQDTVDAYGRFYQFSPGTLYYYHWTNYWDSTVSPYYDMGKLIADLWTDTNWVRTAYNDGDGANDIVMGWVHWGDHNGIAYGNDFFSVSATGVLGGIDWPHDSIAQHEISHNFNAPDHSGTCIMDYWHAYWGIDTWCSSCWNKVYGNIRGLWE